MNTPLLNLAIHAGITAFDIGARGGTCRDLLAIAGAVDYYGFEPDPEECARLNASPQTHPWRRLRYLPYALSQDDNGFELNIYSKRGCSSKLTAKMEMAERYSREKYYVLENVVRVPSKPLGDVVAELATGSPHFIKIDVQGMETDVFQGAQAALRDGVVAVRSEVCFFEMYDGQPLYADIDRALRPFGFVPMRFLELHEWRRRTRAKLPRLDSGAAPFSRGQMAHGDILYLRQPEGLGDASEAEVRQLIRLGMLAVCYEQYDHALASFERRSVREYCMSTCRVDPVDEVFALSRSRSWSYAGPLGLTRRVLNRIARS